MDTMPYFPPRNFNAQLGSVEEVNAVYVYVRRHVRGGGAGVTRCTCGLVGRGARYNLIIVLIGVECGANFLAVTTVMSDGVSECDVCTGTGAREDDGAGVDDGDGEDDGSVPVRSIRTEHRTEPT